MAPTGAADVSVQVSTNRVADSVIQALEERIRTGELKDGEPLPSERDMMDQFHISRTVAREAVQALSNRGLVEARPRFRPVVRKLGYDAAAHAAGSVVAHLLDKPGGLKNLFDTRILVEAALVRQAALHAEKDDVAALKQALEVNGAAIDDSEHFWRTDMDFHGVLYRITGESRAARHPQGLHDLAFTLLGEAASAGGKPNQLPGPQSDFRSNPDARSRRRRRAAAVASLGLLLGDPPIRGGCAKRWPDTALRAPTVTAKRQRSARSPARRGTTCRECRGRASWEAKSTRLWRVLYVPWCLSAEGTTSTNWSRTP